MVDKVFNYQVIEKAIAPFNDSVIVCLETAADYHGLSNGVYMEDLFRVYSENSIPENGIESFVIPDCFNSKKFVTVNNIHVTTVEQTIIDLLEHEDNIDIQTLLESLSNYYYMHNESFAELEGQMNEEQQELLNKWKQDAIDYYDEG